MNSLHIDFCLSCLTGDADRVRAMLKENPALAQARGNVHPDHVAFMEKQGSAGGWTALHLAAHYGQPAVVKLLLDAGADVTALSDNRNGNTPLMAAVAGNRPDVAELLLGHGANPDQLDRQGQFSARKLAEAEEKRALVDLFRRHQSETRQ